MFTVIIESNFTASHAVMMPDGSMKQLHNHNWQLKIAVSRQNTDDLGFAFEFSELQDVVSKVVNEYKLKNLNAMQCFENSFPTAENLARDIYKNIKNLLARTCDLKFVELTEAPGCSVRYYE